MVVITLSCPYPSCQGRSYCLKHGSTDAQNSRFGCVECGRRFSVPTGDLRSAEAEHAAEFAVAARASEVDDSSTSAASGMLPDSYYFSDGELG
jgi:hypothetical protein